mgnify:FL=1
MHCAISVAEAMIVKNVAFIIEFVRLGVFRSGGLWPPHQPSRVRMLFAAEAGDLRYSFVCLLFAAEVGDLRYGFVCLLLAAEAGDLRYDI